jgi:hypothetical protein
MILAIAKNHRILSCGCKMATVVFTSMPVELHAEDHLSVFL